MAKSRPILFSTPMVQALLAGQKTQTRRVVKPQPDGTGAAHGVQDKEACQVHYERLFGVLKCPYGEVGDMLWVRETCWILGKYIKNGLTKTGRQKLRFVTDESNSALYFNSLVKPVKVDKEQMGFHKRPSIFMPKWASRIPLEITNIKVERLRDISASDCVSEGIETKECGLPNYVRNRYKDLWVSLNGDGSWNANPWVWVVEFEVKKEGK